MTTQTAALIANYRLGRIVLHLIAAKGDRQIRWHLSGIVRELMG